MNMNDQEILEQISFIRNLKPLTQTQYKYTMKIYSEFNQMSIKDLITEAEKEDEERIRWKHTQLKNRLLRFRTHVYQNYMEGTAKGHIIRIKAIYKHYEIHIGPLPPLTNRNVNKPTPVRYEDLPTKEDIKKALSLSNNLMTAIILFISSSGCARAETLNLTIQDFITATENYHTQETIPEIITEINNRNDVIPTWRIHRQKTNNDYYTFSTPESTKAITEYLLSDKRKHTPNTPLFKSNTQYLTRRFMWLNQALGGKQTGNYSHIRTHNLRKYHASNLYNHGMSLSDIDALQGRTKKGSHKSYYYENTNTLREKYIEHIEAININQQIQNLSIKTKEYHELETENTNLRNEVEHIKTQVSNILNRMHNDVELDPSDLDL